jgi:GNAT acetyltransferase-like protein
VERMVALSRGALATAIRPEKAVGYAGLARTRGPVRELVLPLFSPFSGLILPQLAESDVHARKDPLAELGSLLESGFDRVRLHLPPSVNDIRPLIWRGWRVSPLYTYTLDPTVGPEKWSASARRTLRKSRSAFQLRVEPEAAAEVVALMLESYSRHGRTGPADAGQITEVCSKLVQSGLAECIVARKETGTAEAGIVLLHGPAASYYWMAGSNPGPAMTVLMAFALETLSQRGVECFDLVGANTPTIAEFKRRFGPELVTYWAATFESGVVSRVVAAGRDLLGK